MLLQLQGIPVVYLSICFKIMGYAFYQSAGEGNTGI